MLNEANQPAQEAASDPRLSPFTVGRELQVPAVMDVHTVKKDCICGNKTTIEIRVKVLMVQLGSFITVSDP